MVCHKAPIHNNKEMIIQIKTIRIIPHIKRTRTTMQINAIQTMKNTAATKMTNDVKYCAKDSLSCDIVMINMVK